MRTRKESRIYMAEWRAKNPKRAKENYKRWRKNNPEKVKAIWLRWYKKNRKNRKIDAKFVRKSL